MKTILVALLFFLVSKGGRAGEIVLPYSAFGPQVAAYELIGMEWWQWDAHGDSKPEVYPIKVVVFWDQTLEETAKNYPVDQAKLKDFRYVEYSKAVKHMERIIMEFRKLELDASPIEQALAKLRKRKIECP